MRALLSISAVALMTALAPPALAQMCGGGQTAAASGQSAGMCGGTMGAGITPAPAASEQKAQAAKSGCSCCQNMAMMQTPADGKDAPMMDMPSQGAPTTPQ
jgi:hypothetical protein